MYVWHLNGIFVHLRAHIHCCNDMLLGICLPCKRVPQASIVSLCSYACVPGPIRFSYLPEPKLNSTCGRAMRFTTKNPMKARGGFSCFGVELIVDEELVR